MAMPLGMAMIVSCENDIAKVQEITNRENMPVESAKNVRIIYSSYANTEVLLEAPVMDNYQNENPYLEYPKGIHVLFYDSLKNVSSELKARYAIQYYNEDKIEARNDVEVIDREGNIINSEQLIWDKKKAKIYTDKFVKITTKDEVLYGDGCESNDTFDKWTIKKPRGNFLVETE